MAFTLSTMAVATGIFSLAALAIAVEALLLAKPQAFAVESESSGYGGRTQSIGSYFGGRSYRSRSRRSDNALEGLESIFAAIEASDKSECGKLLVCNAMTKSEAERTHSESIILKLFPLPEGSAIEEWTAYGKYQWAALAGSFGSPAICTQRYAACPIPLQKLANFVKINY